MLGIEKLKATILLFVAVFNQAKEAAADGVQTMDLFSFIDELAQLPEAINNRDQVLAELNDLSVDERQEIIDAVKEKLNVTDEKAGEIVLNAIDTAAASYKLVRSIVS
jgi:hypothetical protein